MKLEQLKERLSLLFGMECRQKKGDYLTLHGPKGHELIRISWLGAGENYWLVGVMLGQEAEKLVYSVEEES